MGHHGVFSRPSWLFLDRARRCRVPQGPRAKPWAIWEIGVLQRLVFKLRELGCGRARAVPKGTVANEYNNGHISDTILVDLASAWCSENTCVAVRHNGTLVTWGFNRYTGLTNVVYAQCGSAACVAVKGDSTAVVWGIRESGDASTVDLTNIASPPMATTPAPPAASATGDPHLQNIHGERFDLMRSGKAVLIEIPRGQPFEKSWLTVEADAHRLGSQCADMYFQSVNITGAWADKVRAGGLAFTAAGSRDETLQAAQGWTSFGPLKLKVVHGRTSNGIKYLNFYIKHLSEAGAAVGGLLGEDDYTEAATPEKGCLKSMSLEKKASSHSDVGHTEAIASLA